MHRDRVDLFGPCGGTVVATGVNPAGRPRLPIRLMCSLLYLKHAFNQSDEDTCERRAENVVWQYFSGMDYTEPLHCSKADFPTDEAGSK